MQPRSKSPNTTSFERSYQCVHVVEKFEVDTTFSFLEANIKMLIDGQMDGQIASIHNMELLK